MDGLLEQARTIYEGDIDFEGQRLADLLTTVLLSASGIFAFLVGYFTQNIYLALYVGLAGTALTFVAIVPPWPFFNKHPLSWLPARTGRNGGVGGVNIEISGKQ